MCFRYQYSCQRCLRAQSWIKAVSGELCHYCIMCAVLCTSLQIFCSHSFFDLSASSNALVLKMQIVSRRQVVGEAAEGSPSNFPQSPPLHHPPALDTLCRPSAPTAVSNYMILLLTSLHHTDKLESFVSQLTAHKGKGADVDNPCSFCNHTDERHADIPYCAAALIIKSLF